MVVMVWVKRARKKEEGGGDRVAVDGRDKVVHPRVRRGRSILLAARPPRRWERRSSTSPPTRRQIPVGRWFRTLVLDALGCPLLQEEFDRSWACSCPLRARGGVSSATRGLVPAPPLSAYPPRPPSRNPPTENETTARQTWPISPPCHSPRRPRSLLPVLLFLVA